MSGPARPSRRLWLVAVLAALLVAGVVSGFASTSPDGLEQVAEAVGISEQGQEHPATGSPLSDYAVRGVEDERLSTGLAGAAGVVVVLLVAGGLASVLSRRRRQDAPTPAATAPSGGAPTGIDAAPIGRDAATTSSAGPSTPTHGS